MSRQFLNSAADTPPADSLAQSPEQTQDRRQASMGASDMASGHTFNEALAGAFPEWDLLPATPFVRRVK
ncbi:hypothetical protein [Paraburkholderia sp. C35]|uniref:hypothetical protein n=1 Tax=Paraburkholderia sp. C35 TaxID=2126993 RepID=UPI000D6914C9|nr:hypothetical protein [Paraburkholderia sp. C35]